MSEGESGELNFRVEFDDCLCDFYHRIVRDVAQAAKESRSCMRAKGLSDEQFLSPESWDFANLSAYYRTILLDDGLLTSRALVAWCKESASHCLCL